MADQFDEVTKARPMDEQADYVMSHVDEAAEQRQPFEEIWDEVEANFLVRPLNYGSLSSQTNYPVSRHGRDVELGHRPHRAVLKDPETHQSVMSIVSGIVLAIAPEDDGFIKVKRRGLEDVLQAKTVSGLLEYFYRLEGHFNANVEWLMGAGIYGTGIKEDFWDFQEEPRTFRALEFDPFTGEEQSTEQVLEVPVFDDVRSESFSIRDFFPDPGVCNISRMKGAARRFKITAHLARQRAEAGLYNTAAVNRAISSRTRSDDEEHVTINHTEDETGLNQPKASHPDFLEMTGFRYCGQVPFRVKGDPFFRREIVVINGETVRSKVWPRRLPWFDCRITPRLGSFYGISPAELMRYDQDFVDVLKMMLADAVVRSVHPPIIYDKNADVSLAKVRAWSADVPIGANRVDAVQQVPYNPPVGPAFGMYSGVIQNMRGVSTSSNENQGLGFSSGVPRSASAAVGQLQRAGIRPEMFNRVMEQEYLPPEGKYVLGLYQEHLEDSEDLANRIGQSEAVVALADILPDFDITFIGSRTEGTKEQELQAFREIITAGSNPALFPLIPWTDLLRKHFDRLGAHEIAAQVGNPQLIQLFLVLGQLAGGGQNAAAGNGNQATATQPSPGALPAQNFGGVQ